MVTMEEIDNVTWFLQKYFQCGAFINHVDMAGGGGYQMSILLHKPHYVKLSTKRVGRSTYPKICPRGL